MEPIRNALVAVDLTSRSEPVLRAACRVLAGREVRIVLMHVVSDLESLLGVYASSSPVAPLQSDIEDRAGERLAQLRGDLLADFPEVVVELRKGQIWSEVVGAAIASRADLLFLGSHHAEEGRHRFVGDVVAKVTKLAPCPVVVVPSDPV
jgi:nucleotide-binding universal stress UspA family protein